MSVLGVDVGNSGCRVAVFDEQLFQLAAATRSYPPDDVRAEEIRDVVFDGIREVNRQCAHDPVTALAIGAMGETAVGIDGAGRPVTALRMSHHRQGEAQLAGIAARIGPERIRSKTGQPVHAMFTLSHLAWAPAERPEWRKARLILDIGGYLLHALGGPAVFDYTLAARTLAFDTEHRRWDAELLDAAGCPGDRLPPALAVGTAIGEVATDLAASLGFRGRPTLVTGGHDQACAFWGAGADRAGQPVLSLGTTECLTTAHAGRPGALIEANYAAYPVDDGDQWLSLAGTQAGGSAMLWLADLVRRPLTELLDRLPPTPAQALCLPHLLGSGSLENDPDSRGAFTGLSLATTPPDLLLALLEASGFETAKVLGVLRSVGPVADAVRMVGGGIRHARAVSARADAAGVTMTPVPGHSAARGAAILAGAGAGRWSRESAAAAVRTAPAVPPDPAHADWYRRRRAQQARLYPLLSEVISPEVITA